MLFKMLKKSFKINNNLYKENVILEVIDSFKEIAKIDFSENSLSIEWNNEEDVLEIFNEFMNYYIYLKNELTV